MSKDSLSRSEEEIAARQAIERDPHNANAHYDLGSLLEPDPARANEAEAAYRQAIELEPDNPRYIYRLGLLLHEQLQRFEAAETAYRRALEFAPGEPFYYGGLISLLVQQSRRPEALTLSVQMRALLNNSQNWYGLATLDAILGNTEAALDYLRQAAREEDFNRDWARVDPDLTSIRDDPRFAEIVDGS